MKKKILFIMPELKGGGAEKVLIDILKRFDYNRYSVTLLLLEKVGLYIEQIPSDVRVITLFNEGKRLPNIASNHLIRKLLRRLLALVKLPIFTRFDTIVSFMEGEALLYHSLITFKAKRNISWVHTDLVQNHWSKHYFWDTDEEKSSYLKMDSIVCVSNQAKDALAQFCPALTQTATIYNLIDPHEIAAKSTQPIPKEKSDSFLICGCGRLTDPKRFDRFVKAIKIVQDRGYKISGWILGSGYLEEKLREQIIRNQVDIELLGFVSNPMPYIAKSDAFMLSSDSEGYSLVCAEALSLGKPVISTKCTGPAEMLRGDSGILTGFSDTELANAIETLIKDDNQLKKYQRAALERASQFSPQKIMDEIYSALDGSRGI